MKESNTFLLVDSNALIHRAYHALPMTMTSSSGELTNAVYGFTSALIHAIEQFSPTHVICCFDVKGATFRHDQYDLYKAQRKEMDEGLAVQLPRINDVVEALGIPIVTKEGFEADDLIGTLAKHYEKQGRILILTGDKDALQLVSDQTSVVALKQGMKDPQVYTPQTLKEEYGMTSEEFIVYKALRGDPSDNIPGVSGVGQVTAIKLVQEYHDLDHLYKALEEDPAKHPLLKGKLRETLIKEKDIAELSLKLSTIDRDVKIDFDITKASFDTFDKEKVIALFKQLGFRSLIPRLDKISVDGSSDTNTDTPKQQSSSDVSIITPERLKKLLRDHNKGPISLHYSWSGQTARQGSIAAVAVAFDKDHAHVLSWTADLVKILSELFKSNAEFLLWDAKTLMHLLANNGIVSADSYTDLMLTSQLLEDKTEIASSKSTAPIADDQMLTALGEQAMQMQLNYKQLTKALQESGQQKLLETVEQPLIPVLFGMEQQGIVLNVDLLKQLSKQFNEELGILEKKIWKEAGQEFNVASPQQLRTILFEKLQIGTDGIKKTKTKVGLSTDAATLETLRPAHPIIDLILQYRELAKLIGTYVDALPILLDPKTKRIHTTYNQIGAATGRLASIDPNLQNIPIRSQRGDQVRRAFTAPKGWKLLSIDYSQIELRILAHLSGDKAMQQSFKSGHDIHVATAASLNNVPESEVTKEMRRAAKTINFGLLYGLSAHRLSVELGLPYDQASDFIKRYFDTYPGIKKLLEQIVTKARSQGYYQTLFGRRRLFPELNSTVWALRQSSERMAMNFPMQGSQADILKMAMIEVNKRLKDAQDDIHLLLCVHDELVFEVKEGKEQQYFATITDCMTSVCTLSVPLEVEGKVGDNWGEMVDL